MQLKPNRTEPHTKQKPQKSSNDEEKNESPGIFRCIKYMPFF